MLNIYEVFYEDLTCEQAIYYFDASKFAQNNNISAHSDWLGFTLISTDDEDFLSKIVKKPDGNIESFYFFSGFNPEKLLISKDGTYLASLCTGVPFDVNMWAIYRDQQTGEYAWSKLPIVINCSKKKRLFMKEQKPVLSTSSVVKSFVWEKELTDNFDFIGQPSNKAIEFIKSNYKIEITPDVLVAMLRVYRGYGFNILLYKLVNEATHPDHLKDLLSSNILDKTASKVANLAYEALLKGERYEMPYNKFIPLMENCDYVGVLSLYEHTLALIYEIKRTYRMAPNANYPASTEIHLMQLHMISGSLLKSESFQKNTLNTAFIQSLFNKAQPEVFYQLAATNNLTFLDSVVLRFMSILKNMEISFALNVKMDSDSLQSIRSLREILTENKKELDVLFTKKDRLNTGINSTGALSQAKMKLANYTSKFNKFGKAYADKKMSEQEWLEKAPKLEFKINEIKREITESEQKSFDDIQRTRCEVTSRIQVLKKSIEVTSRELDKAPIIKELNVNFRQFFKAGTHVNF